MQEDARSQQLVWTLASSGELPQPPMLQPGLCQEASFAGLALSQMGKAMPSECQAEGPFSEQEFCTCLTSLSGTWQYWVSHITCRIPAGAALSVGEEWKRVYGSCAPAGSGSGSDHLLGLTGMLLFALVCLGGCALIVVRRQKACATDANAFVPLEGNEEDDQPATVEQSVPMSERDLVNLGLGPDPPPYDAHAAHPGSTRASMFNDVAPADFRSSM